MTKKFVFGVVLLAALACGKEEDKAPVGGGGGGGGNGGGSGETLPTGGTAGGSTGARAGGVTSQGTFLGSITKEEGGMKVCVDTTVSGAAVTRDKIAQFKQQASAGGQYSEAPCDAASADASCKVKQSQAGMTASLVMHFYGLDSDVKNQQAEISCQFLGGTYTRN